MYMSMPNVQCLIAQESEYKQQNSFGSYRNSYIDMRIEKENQFTSFSKLLNRIDATNLGEYELKVLKQEHQYLDRLRHQRMKIEELKKKYDECQSQLNQQKVGYSQLSILFQEKCQIIQNLEHQLTIEIGKRESLQKNLQKQLESDKVKSKGRMKDLEHENQELKRAIRQKQLMVMSLEEEYNEKLKKMRDSYQIQKRTLITQLEDRLQDAKSKNSESEVLQLRNLVARQNKALKLQNQKYTQIVEKHESLTLQLQTLQQTISSQNSQIHDYEQKIQQFYNQIQQLQNRLEKQDNDKRLKGQLEQIRRKMNEMQKGQIQRIQFIVNQME